MRVFAALAVVIIHATAGSTHQFHAAGSWISLDGLGTFLNQWARFSVPLFLFLSGFGLECSALKKKSPSWIAFYKERLVKVAFPYLFYALVVLLITWQGPVEAFEKAKNFLSVKSPDYHLYFIKIIVQCYLLFPILRHVPRLSLLIGLSFSLVYFYPGQLLFESFFGFKPFYMLASVVFPWLPYFTLGILFARNSDQKWKISNTLSLMILALLFLVFEYSMRAQALRFIEGASGAYYDHFHRYTVFFYSVATFMFFYAAKPFQKIYDLSLIKSLGKFSFFIYLAHPIFLRLASLLGMDFFVLKALVGFWGAFGLGLVLDKLLRQSSKVRVILGLS